MNAKPPVATSPGVDEAFAEAHREMRADPAIQFDFPDAPPPPEPSFIDIGPILQAFFWLAVAAIVLFLGYLIATRLAGAEWPWRRRPADEAAGADSWRPEEREARELLGEADALAADGRYSEAAHLLLFRSIEDIDEKRPTLVRPALTSRDIAALDALPITPRAAFGRIAMMVERSLFAQRPLGAADWSDCRAAYHEFAFAEGWRG